MCNIQQEDKRFVPVDFSAITAWLYQKENAIAIENLGGGGPHYYEFRDGIIKIDGGRGRITAEMWQEVCKDMVTHIPHERLNRPVEYSHYPFFVQAPSIPVLCWAFCEEFLNGNKVWNY